MIIIRVRRLFYFPQVLPPGAEPGGSEFLAHLPVFVHPGGSEFDTVVPHAEIDIIDGVHEAAMLARRVR